MNAATDPLWQALEAFQLDQPGVAFSFSQRLATENGWSGAFAQRVVVEYKRFIWLAMRSGHPVTPSDEVDQAWHLHLAYTRSYWDEMCAHILKQPLHHGPTKGGADEATKFGDWYGKTKESYARCFGEPTPADIWPSHAQRFDPRRQYQRIDTASFWMISKVAAWHPGSKMAATIVGGIVSCGLFLVSCQNDRGGDLSGFILILVLILGMTLLLRRLNRRGKGRGGSGCGGASSCGTGGCGSSGKGHHDSNGCGSSHEGGGSGCGSSGCGGGGCGGGGGD